MAIKRFEAIVLRHYNLAESDKIVLLFTREMGKIQCIAKGSRKINYQYTGILEILSHISLLAYCKEGRRLNYLKSCEFINSFYDVRYDSLKFYISSYIAEVSNYMLKEGDPNPDIFDFLIDFISILSKSDNINTLLRIFEFRFLSLAGFMPVLNRCSRCKCLVDQKGIWYGFLKNGILCYKCRFTERESIRINIGAKCFLEKVLSLELEKANRLHIPKSMERLIEQITHKSLIYRAEREFKSYKLILRN